MLNLTAAVAHRPVFSAFVRNNAIAAVKKPFEVQQRNCSVLSKSFITRLNVPKQNDQNVRFLSLWGWNLWGGAKKTTLENPVVPPTPEIIPEIKTPSLSADDSGYIYDPVGVCDEGVVFSALGDPSLAALGLSSWWPTYWMCQVPIEFLHGTCGLEWWSSILTLTLVVRLCLLPVNIKFQQEKGRMEVVQKMGELSKKIEAAQKNDNYKEIEKLQERVKKFLEEHDIKPKDMSNRWKIMRIFFGPLVLPLTAQGFFLGSTFVGTRRLCNLPVESMTHDAFFGSIIDLSATGSVLPAITVLGLLAGFGTLPKAKEMSPLTKCGIVVASSIPLYILSCMSNGILINIMCTTFFSATFAHVIRNPSVRNKFSSIGRIPELPLKPAYSNKNPASNVVANIWVEIKERYAALQEGRVKKKSAKAVEDVRRKKREADALEAGAPVESFSENPRLKRKKKQLT